MKHSLRKSLCLLLLTATAPVLATIMVPLTDEEAVSQADLIVQGRILDVRSFWNKERTAILTEARFQVEETLLGEPSRVVAVRTIGGQVGDVRIVFDAAPELKAGDRQLLFLKKHPDGAFRVVGARQRQYRIRMAPDGREMAVPLLEPGPTLETPEGDEVPRPKTLPVVQLKRQIRDTAYRIGRPIEQ